MAGFAMASFEKEREKADEWLKSEIGLSWRDLDPNKLYDLEIFVKFLEVYAEASPTREKAYRTTGTRVFPTAKREEMLPPNLSGPIDFLQVEFDLYLRSLEGPNIHPRKLLQATDGDVRIEVKNPPYRAFDLLMEGVFLGAVSMAGVKNAEIEQTKCALRGDDVCEYRITW